jgi:hypothetical protein
VISFKIYLQTELNSFNSHLASNEKAWQTTRDTRGIASIPFPSDDMVWGTAGTRYATSWPHIDDHGMGTLIRNVVGRKYWALARPQPDVEVNGAGDEGSINAYPVEWQRFTSGEYWDYEGVVLEPGDLL